MNWLFAMVDVPPHLAEREGRKAVRGRDATPLRLLRARTAPKHQMTPSPAGSAGAGRGSAIGSPCARGRWPAQEENCGPRAPGGEHGDHVRAKHDGGQPNSRPERHPTGFQRYRWGSHPRSGLAVSREWFIDADMMPVARQARPISLNRWM